MEIRYQISTALLTFEYWILIGQLQHCTTDSVMSGRDEITLCQLTDFFRKHSWNKWVIEDPPTSHQGPASPCWGSFQNNDELAVPDEFLGHNFD